MLLGMGSCGPHLHRPVAKRTLTAAVLGLAATAVLAPSAHAQAGGAASTAFAPAIASIACTSGCAGAAGDATGTVTVEQGGTVALGGRALDRASAVVFLGARGSRDDVRARARATSATSLDVKVPAKARSGHVALVTAAGVASQSHGVTVRVVKPASTTYAATLPAPVLRPIPGVDQLEAGFVTRKAGKAASAASIAYVSRAAAAVTVRVDVVRLSDGLSIFSDERSAATGQQQTVAWDGRSDAGLASDGRYDVRVSTVAGSAPRTTAAPDTGAAAAGGAAPAAGGSPPPSGSARVGGFTFVGAVFPVSGPHTYGEDGAAFGAGRGGRSHAGQDVLAKCGTPIVTARGGTVKHTGVQGAAGNYAVISDPVTGEDHGYMHLATPATVARGARVETGQQIGTVGRTGNATACLLHFELWTSPGWYSGGTVVDPLPTLKRWDRLG
ncbi:M23 family metallopeptidase [Conexibacter woesei]|uniref:Peptidase M23 n=1 Tax=Conexibacter woesei (strain DSM 14684 / CCUG 47730 / CIP 108061 / JCM 11494 / NBRC 100937 / ID131577) TaxID=469383 RepID=D3F326_CONWI|nr:M23 family metallopeptidase [Conexibacter woesei]ADB50306.1 Peptidase M23 [Conexibacter woesei DSM 14684]